MSSSSKLVVVALILVASLLSSSTTNIIASARNLELILTDMHKFDDETSLSCWDALLELQSCSGEVVLFFMNGDTRLSANCCSAIRTMHQQCWPSILGSIGITTEESDVLRGYCDGIVNGQGDGSSATSSPPPKETVN